MASRFYLTFTPSYTNTHRFQRFLFPTLKRSSVGPIRVQDGGDSYLGMWRKAMDKERKEIEFNKIANRKQEDEEEEDLEAKSREFLKILEVPAEERDRVQRIQVIDRAVVAIAVVSTLLKEEKMNVENESNLLQDLDHQDDGGDFNIEDS